MTGLLVFTVHTIRHSGYFVKYLYYLIYYFLRTKINFSIDILYELCQPFLTGGLIGCGCLFLAYFTYCLYAWYIRGHVIRCGLARCKRARNGASAPSPRF